MIHPEDLAAAAEKALAFANTLQPNPNQSKLIRWKGKRGRDSKREREEVEEIKIEEEDNLDMQVEEKEKVTIPTKCIKETLKVCQINQIDHHHC